ncbi:UNVERIFIED_CONTAM: hypothetical protein NCL1_29516 [Trichonephila clavipes]
MICKELELFLHICIIIIQLRKYNYKNMGIQLYTLAKRSLRSPITNQTVKFTHPNHVQDMLKSVGKNMGEDKRKLEKIIAEEATRLLIVKQ